MSSTGKSTVPAKPSKQFPLFAHQNGQWAKKVRGRLLFFGVWREPDIALARWLREREHLLSGGLPPPSLTGPTLTELCRRFLSHKQRLLDAQELSSRSLSEYQRVCRRILSSFGQERLVNDLRAEDFEQFRSELARTLGRAALRNEMQRMRVVFDFGRDVELIDTPVQYGAGFRDLGRRNLRLERQAKGTHFFEADQLRAILNAADGQLRVMILLGVNCGFSNADCARLPLSALDSDFGWLRYARPDTCVDRRIPLWPETSNALRGILSKRVLPESAEDAEVVFVNDRGLRWNRDARNNSITKAMAKLLKSLELHQTGLGFSALRYTFARIGSEAKDLISVDYIMGHADTTMSAIYRQPISDSRLRAVTDYVRAWLFPPPK